MSGEKTIETRRYNLPSKYLGKPLAIIETPGPNGKKLGNVQKASIIGVMTISSTYEYKTEAHWKREYKLHKVPINDPQYKFEVGIARWAWTVTDLIILSEPCPAPLKRGIIFAKECSVNY